MLDSFSPFEFLKWWTQNLLYPNFVVFNRQLASPYLGNTLQWWSISPCIAWESATQLWDLAQLLKSKWAASRSKENCLKTSPGSSPWKTFGTWGHIRIHTMPCHAIPHDASTLHYIYICMYITFRVHLHLHSNYICTYGLTLWSRVPCSYPANGMGPQVPPYHPLPSICKLLATFLRSSLVFARSLQHFWLPDSHLLGACYLLDDLRCNHFWFKPPNIINLFLIP